MKTLSLKILCLGCLLTIMHLTSSSLTIDSCYILARQNYPLLKQLALIEKSTAYSVENANKGFLPQLIVGGQATYQSEVTKVPIAIPGMNLPELSKDQYKLYGEVSQPLTDIKTISDQRELVKTNAASEKQRIEVELYKLKERINGLYFGILLIDAQVQQTLLLKKDLQTGLDKTNTAVNQGTALKSSLDMIKADMLKADQRLIELRSNRKVYVDMLSMFIHQTLDENVSLEKPVARTRPKAIMRPELNWYDMQKQGIALQNKLLTDRSLPKFNLFLQAGIGRPALNMLSNDVKEYYIGGIRLNWNVASFYTYGKEKQIIGINQHTIDVQKEAFIFNTELSLHQQYAEEDKVTAILATDIELIHLREQIKNAVRNQLEQGTATSGDYLIAVNAEDQARQNMLVHELQLLMNKYTTQNISGN